jgi:hypothetical protein
MVSRKHAKIAMQGDQIWIEDLGSTNGTFVNGEKIKRSRLKEGDRVLIGTSILKVIAGDSVRDSADAKIELENVAHRARNSQQRTMSGSIEEVPLPDLLQLFGTSKKSGVLVIRTDDDVGRIHLKKGNISFAIINDLDDVAPLKALYRMLTWQKGLFDLEPAEEREFSGEMNASVQEVLMDGMRQLDEFNRLREQMPELRARAQLHGLRDGAQQEPRDGPRDRRDPAEADQGVLSSGRVRRTVTALAWASSPSTRAKAQMAFWCRASASGE